MLVVIRVGREECRIVAGRREEGVVRVGRRRRQGRMARGAEVVGVRISLNGVSLLYAVVRESGERTLKTSRRGWGNVW